MQGQPDLDDQLRVESLRVAQAAERLGLLSDQTADFLRLSPADPAAVASSQGSPPRQATTVREASVCVFVQWSGTPELWTKPKSYPATPDGWQRMITDEGWQP